MKNNCRRRTAVLAGVLTSLVLAAILTTFIGIVNGHPTQAVAADSLANTAQVIAVTGTSQTFTFPTSTQNGRGCIWTQAGDAQVFIDWTGGDFGTVAANTAAGQNKTFINAGESIRIPAAAHAFSVKTASNTANTATLQYVADAKQ